MSNFSINTLIEDYSGCRCELVTMVMGSSIFIFMMRSSCSQVLLQKYKQKLAQFRSALIPASVREMADTHPHTYAHTHAHSPITHTCTYITHTCTYNTHIHTSCTLTITHIHHTHTCTYITHTYMHIQHTHTYIMHTHHHTHTSHTHMHIQHIHTSCTLTITHMHIHTCTYPSSDNTDLTIFVVVIHEALLFSDYSNWCVSHNCPSELSLGGLISCHYECEGCPAAKMETESAFLWRSKLQR